MPYKRPGSQYWQIRKYRLPAFGDTGALATGVLNKRTAERMEVLLEDLAAQSLIEPKWKKLLEAVKAKQVHLQDLLAAKMHGRLELLLRNLNDPLLHEAIDRFIAIDKSDRTTILGFGHVKTQTTSDTRLSFLSTPTNILEILVAVEKTGVKRNSVRRMVHRAISKLVTHTWGKAERDRIFAEVIYAGEDDTREIRLSSEEMTKLVNAALDLGYRDLAIVIKMSLLTSADRGVLLKGQSHSGPTRGLLKRDLNIFAEPGPDGEEVFSGTALLVDTKTETRTRTAVLPDSLARELAALVENKDLDDPVFDLRYQELDFPWRRVREVAGLTSLHFKDLRAQFAIHGQDAGLPTAVISKAMGHSHERMTARYQRHERSLTTEQAEALEAKLFGAM